MKKNLVIRGMRRAISLLFLGLAVAGSRTHIIINRLLGGLKGVNLAWWQKGLLITLQLYDRFRDRNGEDNDQKR